LPAFAVRAGRAKKPDHFAVVQQVRRKLPAYLCVVWRPDQNLILLDGVPVYNAHHYLFCFGIYAQGCKCRILQRRFPCSLWRPLSSVIDVRMKDGNKNHSETDITIGENLKIHRQDLKKKEVVLYNFST
jgi:hypothetical protein